MSIWKQPRNFCVQCISRRTSNHPKPITDKHRHWLILQGVVLKYATKGYVLEICTSQNFHRKSSSKPAKLSLCAFPVIGTVSFCTLFQFLDTQLFPLNTECIEKKASLCVHQLGEFLISVRTNVTSCSNYLQHVVL